MRCFVPSLGAALVALVLNGCSGATRRNAMPTLARQSPTARDRAQRATLFAAAQIGKRYCWGGIGPDCFDCSGLVQQSWLSAGVRLPRTADAIAAAAPEVSLDELQPGDVLWWPGHVGIYAGRGAVIDAYDSRHGVVRRPAIHPRRAFRPAALSLYD